MFESEEPSEQPGTPRPATSETAGSDASPRQPDVDAEQLATLNARASVEDCRRFLVEIATLLARLDAAEMSDAALVEAVAASERLAAGAQAGQARFVGELLRRRGSSGPGFDEVVDEVRARLATTGHAAHTKVALAAALDTYPEVADALAIGSIDPRKAAVLTDRQPGVSERDHRDLTRELVTEAAGSTAPQLQARVRQHALEHDPDAAQRRHEAEYTARHVRIEPLADAMARVTAYVRADDAQRVRACLDVLADDTRGGRAGRRADPRTIDQRRADVFVNVFTHARELVELSAERGEPRASGADTDGPPTDAAPADPAGENGSGRTSQGTSRRRPRAEVQVTIGAGTLLGMDDEPGELAGHGPIPADVTRRIAADATWRALIVDANGEFAALGTKAYRPGVILDRTVRARHMRCSFPGCGQPAVYCDLDHIIEYDPALADRLVQTTELNLHPLCRRHHNLKTSKRWKVVREPDGTLVWITPTGHRYRSRPDPPPGSSGAWRQRTGPGRRARASSEGESEGPAA
ncbi:HNH endonuclease signature motif containing protein [Georgenia deserti]|uniref:DUF222 domain-containing protein n=1 Tax=Georgenia deserti TaxID=2093781 RepID=A0ABW4L688_9MICO